jgi:hypothetical protein
VVYEAAETGRPPGPGARGHQGCGASFGERSAERTNRRNGYRERRWDTRAGTIELAIPKLREGAIGRTPSDSSIERP